MNEPSHLPTEKRLAFAVLILLVAGCARETSKEADALSAAKSAYRKEIFDDCMQRLPAGPATTHYNDWDDVVEACDKVGYYQMNTRFP